MRLPTALILSFAIILLSSPSAVSAQQQQKIPRLGYLSPGDVPYYDNAFLHGLQDHGYILQGEIPRYDDSSWQRMLNQGYFDGKRIRIEIRATGQHFERAPQLAAELVSLNVDAIFVIGAPLVKTVQDAVAHASKSIPIVFGPEFDPVGKGLVASLARPGGNITGVATVDPDFDAKRLQLLKETFPRLTRVTYLVNPAFDRDYFVKSEPPMHAAAQAMRIRLDILEVNSPEDLQSAFTEIDRRHIEAIVLPSRSPPILLANRELLRDLVAKRRLPAMYGDVIFVENGGLMSYGATYADLKRRSAGLVAKILKGAKPGDMPVEQATTFELVINLRTAHALRLNIPNEILSRADRVIR
jgi:putative ABC transport system substrate-binding protein